MSRDYAEMEREFIDSLKADTGRDLGEWMVAIGAQDLANRNDTIDWLRQQGFLFAWASWLERIHHNGGKPIYVDAKGSDTPAVPGGESSPRVERVNKASSSVTPENESVTREPHTPPEVRQPSLRLVHSAPAVATPPPEKTPALSDREATSAPVTPLSGRSAGSVPADIRALIASAKAFAPLAGFIVRKITETIPATELSPGKKSIVFSAPLPFAVIGISGKGLKLGFPGPPGVFQGQLEKAKPANFGGDLPSGFTHMTSLSDARQLDDEFTKAIQDAWSRSNAT